MPRTATRRSIKYLAEAIKIQTELGRFGPAAKMQKEIAEIYDAEMDVENAIENYRVASDYFAGEESHSQANQCLLKVAKMLAELDGKSR